VFVRKKDAENVESLNKDQDAVARFPTSHASHIEPASTSIMKNTGHSDAGQSQEVGSDILLSDSMSLCHYVTMSLVWKLYHFVWERRLFANW